MAPGVDVIPNRSSRPAILLREAWREGTRIRRRTVANLSRMPPELVDAVRAALKGGIVLPSLDDAAAIRRSLPHGHVAAVLGTLRSLGMVRILGREPSRMRSLAAAAIAARLIDPGSKLACARSLSRETASSSLGRMFGLGPVEGNEVELPAIPERPPAIASRPTKLQERAFGLLGTDSLKTVAMQMAGRKV